MRKYYKELACNTISIINSLVSTTSFISYSFGMLLFRPTLEAKFFPSQMKLEIILLHWQKRCNLNWEILPQFLICDPKLKPLDYTFLFFYKKLSKFLFCIFFSFILLVETQDTKTCRCPKTKRSQYGLRKYGLF